MFNELRSLFAKAIAPSGEVPESTGAKTKAVSGETGWSESLLYAKNSWPKYNPDDLMGRKGYGVYKKMTTDEQVKAVTRFKRDAITGRRWFFEFDKKDLMEANKTEEANPSNPEGGSEVPIVSKDSSLPKMIRFDATPIPPEEVIVPEQDSIPSPTTELPGGATEEEKNALTEEQELRVRVFEQVITQMEGSFYDALNKIMTAMLFGFSLVEKVEKDIEVDGKTWVGIKRLALKPFDTFWFLPDEYGNIKECIQRFEGFQQTIDLDRYIHLVQNPEVDPHYGQSELREAYRSWFSKDMAIRFWNIHLERHASGFFKAQPKDGVDLRANTPEYTSLVNAINNLSPKTGIILPSGIEAELVHPTNTDAYEKAIAVHDKAIAKSLLVPNLLGISEQGSTGSYSQSQTQLEAFLWTLEAETRRLEEILNEHLFKSLGEINFGSGPYPQFRFKPLSEAMKMEVIRVWVELVKASAVKPTDEDEDHIRKLLDFPEAGEPLDQPSQVPIGLPGVAIDPATGNPTMSPGNKPPGTKLPAQPGKRPGETVMGQQQIKTQMRAEFLARAVKRVDFAVIDNSGTKITSYIGAKMAETLRAGVEDMKLFITEADLFTNPDKIAEVKLPTKTLTKIRKLAESGLKDGWDLGATHARRELEKAQGKRFAVDPMRLSDIAAQKFLESRSFTLAGDLADSVRKKVTIILYNAIKGGWALTEILSRIDDELGATVLPHASTAIRTTVFEAINEARYELFASPEVGNFVEALEFSAILDGKTTVICEHMDGRIYPTNDPIWEDYTPPLHFNCRSLLVAVTTEDTWTRSANPELSPQDGFGGG